MLDLQPFSDPCGELKANTEDAGLDDSLDDDISLESVDDDGVNAEGAIPDKDKFPLLHSLFSQNDGSNLLSQLINEMLRFNNGSKVLNHTKGNNTLGTLLEGPQFRNLKGYARELQKNDNILVSLCNHVAKCSNCDANEASEMILAVFFDHFQDSFLSVAVSKGVPQKTMDEVSVEAMLSEAGVNWKSARILFHHLK